MYDVSVSVTVSYLDTTARKVSALYLDTKSGEVCTSYLDTFKKYLWTPLLLPQDHYAKCDKHKILKIEQAVSCRIELQ